MFYRDYEGEETPPSADTKKVDMEETKKENME